MVNVPDLSYAGQPAASRVPLYRPAALLVFVRVHVGDPEPGITSSRPKGSRLAVSTIISNECPRSPINALHDYSSQQQLLEEFKALGWATDAKISCGPKQYPSTMHAEIAVLDRNSVWLGMVHQHATTYQRFKLARR